MTSSPWLSSIINNPAIALYQDQLRTAPLEDIIDQMRTDLSVKLSSEKPAIEIRFTYTDRSKAEMAVRALAAASVKIPGSMAETTGNKPIENASGLKVIDAASLPIRPLALNPWLIALIGILSGLSIYLLSRTFRKPALLPALAGVIAGVAIAWFTPEIATLLPDGTLPVRYQSQATMYLAAADTALLPTLLVEVSSRWCMAYLIGDPRLQLYPDLLKRHSLDDIAENMRRDVVIASRGHGAGDRMIDISFTYPDRIKSQMVVSGIMSRLDVIYESGTRGTTPAPSRSTQWGSIETGHAPVVTVETKRPYSTSPIRAGFVTGLLLAALIATVRRRWIAEHEEPQPLRFSVPRFRKLAIWLTAAGTVVGVFVAWRNPALHTSDATVALENVPRDRVAQLVDQAVSRELSRHSAESQDDMRRHLTWHQLPESDAKNLAIRIQFTGANPSFARQFLNGVLDEIAHETESPQIPQVSPPRAMAFDIPWARPDGPTLSGIPIDPLGPEDPTALLVDGSATRMRYIDTPSLPQDADGPGWSAVAVGAGAGLLIAALASLLGGLGRASSLGLRSSVT